MPVLFLRIFISMMRDLKYHELLYFSFKFANLLVCIGKNVAPNQKFH
jgi:hypothetical protein